MREFEPNNPLSDVELRAGAERLLRVTIETGWVDADLEVEFPELRLRWIAHEGGSGRTPPEIKERLRKLSDRYTGGKAVHLRQEPIPWAYRVFFRQVGIDPDDHRTPAEQAALDRMKHGSFRSRNLLDDALVIATVETGVPVHGARRGQGRRRRSGCGSPTRASGSAATAGRSRCGRSSSPTPTARSPCCSATSPRSGGSIPATERMLLCTVQVKGVPEISVEEALWTVTEVLRTGS